MANDILFLPDGTEVRLVPLERTGGKALYVSADGRCFSFYRRVPRLIKPQPTNSAINRYNGRRKQHYLRMRSYGNILVHHAVHLAWIGPIPEGYVVDHLNGITADNRIENIQAVTPEENVKRARLLRILRRIGRDPRLMSREELLEIFNKYYFANNNRSPITDNR
ncbi:MAG: HNH endonuclease [Paludibacteraceae bacterium]|nr:HNH endonuclease [Paludibacteraceae bacterium]